MDKNVRISIIIPCYNVQCYIEECLNSLINQTFKHFEIICVDDGSNDNTIEIVNEYAEKYQYIKVISQTNQYAGVARNNGMQYAIGDYLLFLDSDDFFELDMLEKIYQKAIDSDADIVLFDGNVYLDIEKEFKENYRFLFVELLEGVELFSKDNCDLIYQITMASIWTKIFKRKFILESEIEFSCTKNSNDLFFCYIALACANKISYIDERFVHHRMNTGNSLQDNCCIKNIFIFDVLLDIYIELKKRNLWIPNVKNSLINAFISNIYYILKKYDYLDDKMKFIEDLSNHDLYKTDFLTQNIDFYYEINNNRAKFIKIRNIINTYQWKKKYLSKRYNIKYEITQNKKTAT